MITSVVMISLAAVVGLPFYYVLVNTLKTQAETTASPLALPTSLNLTTTPRSSPTFRSGRRS